MRITRLHTHLSFALGLPAAIAACRTLPTVETSREDPGGEILEATQMEIVAGHTRFRNYGNGKAFLDLAGLSLDCQGTARVGISFERTDLLRLGETYDIAESRHLFVVDTAWAPGFAECGQDLADAPGNNPCEDISGTLQIDFLDSQTARGSISLAAQQSAQGENGALYQHRVSFDWNDFSAPFSDADTLDACVRDG